jgi:hypothetical protein
MVAIFVLGTVIGSLLELVHTHLARLADARQELSGSRLAEARLREIQLSAQNLITPSVGKSEGVFDPPYDYLHWELVVEPASIPLPADVATDGAASSSVIFGQSSTALDEGGGSAVLRVELRVFHVDRQDPQSVPPYILYVVEPLSEADLLALEEARVGEVTGEVEEEEEF